MKVDCCGIYKIENKVNSKIYVGLSKHIYTRWQQHKHELNKGIHHNFYLQNAWRKYGQKNFEFRIIEECDLNQLCSKEKIWIKKYDSFFNGYNLTLGGDGVIGYGFKEKLTGLSNARKLLLDENTLSIIQIIARTENVGKFFYGQESFKKLIFELRKEEESGRNEYFIDKLENYWNDGKMRELILHKEDYNYYQLMRYYCGNDRPNRNYFIFECIQYAYLSLLQDDIKVTNTYCTKNMPFNVCGALAPPKIFKMATYPSETYKSLPRLFKVHSKHS